MGFRWERLEDCRPRAGVTWSCLMDEPAPLPMVTTTVRTVDADTVFSALGDPTRRRMLVKLADGQWHISQSMGGTYPKHHDLARKHLDVLTRAGLVVAETDPEDQRRRRYRLAPTVKAEMSPEGRRTLDFGYCVLRC
jgi:DNA-binding transcriptional ArsR family regulator